MNNPNIFESLTLLFSRDARFVNDPYMYLSITIYLAQGYMSLTAKLMARVQIPRTEHYFHV